MNFNIIAKKNLSAWRPTYEYDNVNNNNSISPLNLNSSNSRRCPIYDPCSSYDPCPPYNQCPPPCPPNNNHHCKATGQLIENPGMETFTMGKPTNWTTTTSNLVSQNTAQGRVHSGQSSVNLVNGANLSQLISIKSGCFYEFSFFAHAEGANVSLTATVTFINSGQSTQGAVINIASQDLPNDNRNFGFYKAFTIKAPEYATQARITFNVTATGGQSVDLDDVSFTVQ